MCYSVSGNNLLKFHLKIADIELSGTINEMAGQLLQILCRQIAAYFRRTASQSVGHFLKSTPECPFTQRQEM